MNHVNAIVVKTDNDYTIWFFRVVIFISSTAIFCSIKYAVYNTNQDDYHVFNDALENHLGLRVAISCGLFTSIPMILDLILDLGAPKSLQFLLSERFTFVLSLILGTFPLTLFRHLDNISQIFIASEAVRDLLVMYTCGAGLYKVDPDVFTSLKFGVICVLMGFIWTLDVYDANAPVHIKETAPYIFRENIVYFTLYSIYLCYFVLLTISTRKLYGIYKKNKSENIEPLLSTRNMLNIILMYGLLGLFLPIFIYNNFIRKKGNISSRSGHDLVVRTYVHLMLMIIMVIFPARLLRHEICHVRQSINTKKSIARHVYREIRTPLNIVVMGLDLLSGTLPIRSNLNPNGITDEIVEYSKPELSKLTRIKSGIELFNKDAEAGSNSRNGEKAKTLRRDSLVLLDSINVSCNTVVNIVNDMLTVASLEDKMGLKCNRYDVDGFIQHIMKPFKLHAKQKRILLKFIDRIPAKKVGFFTVKHCVEIDGNKVGQVFRNFMANALNFTPEKGTIVVVIKCAQSDTSKVDKEKFHKDNAVGRYKRAREVKKNRKKKSKNSNTNLNSIASASSYDQFSEDSFNRYNQDLRENSGFGGSSISGFNSNSNWDSEVGNSAADVLGPDGTSLFMLNKENPMVRIAVTDTGAGISSTDIRKLFHSVLHLDDDSEVQGGGGSGFGLKIAKGVIEQHGGRVGVSSNGVGKGATFYLELPLYSQWDDGSVRVDPDGLIHTDPLPVQTVTNVTDAPHETNHQNQIPVSDLVEDLSVEGGKSFTFLSNVPTVPLMSYGSGFPLPSPSGDNSSGTPSADDCSFNSTPASSINRLRPVAAVAHNGNYQIKRVLLADSSSVSRRLIRKILVTMDSKLLIDEAASGDQCIELVLEKYGRFHDVSYYDAVIVDNRFPSGRSGYDTARALRTDLDGGFINPFADSMCYTGLIIGITALTDEVDLQNFTDAGADVVLTKPVDTRRLLSILREYKGE